MKSRMARFRPSVTFIVVTLDLHEVVKTHHLRDLAHGLTKTVERNQTRDWFAEKKDKSHLRERLVDATGRSGRVKVIGRGFEPPSARILFLFRKQLEVGACIILTKTKVRLQGIIAIQEKTGFFRLGCADFRMPSEIIEDGGGTSLTRSGDDEEPLAYKICC